MLTSTLSDRKKDAIVAVVVAAVPPLIDGVCSPVEALSAITGWTPERSREAFKECERRKLIASIGEARN